MNCAPGVKSAVYDCFVATRDTFSVCCFTVLRGPGDKMFHTLRANGQFTAELLIGLDDVNLKF